MKKTTAFMLIDYHFLTGNFDKALQSVEKTLDFFGQDAALLNLKAIALVQSGELEKAESIAKESINSEPDLMASYWTLASIQNSAQKYEALTRTFALIEETFDLSMSADDIRNTPQYSGYTQSPEFKSWANK